DFDETQAVSPFSIIPDNEFGRTVNSMPDMTNGDVRAARDGEDELLISAPNSYGGRGAVHVIFGQEYSAFGDGAGVNSIPNPRSGPYPNERFIKGHSIGDRLGY